MKDAILEDICDFDEPFEVIKRIPIDPIHLEIVNYHVIYIGSWKTWINS